MARQTLMTVFCLFLVLGSASPAADKPTPEKKALGFASPDEAWEVYRHAMHEGRWREAFQCLTPNAQAHEVRGLVFAAAYLRRTSEKAVAEKLNGIFKEHRLDLEQIEKEAENVETKEETAKYTKELNRRVKDREGLFAEARAAMDKLMPHATDEDGKRVIAYGKLMKLEIADLRATGECIQELDERKETFITGGVRQDEVTHEVNFRKINGRWFVD